MKKSFVLFLVLYSAFQLQAQKRHINFKLIGTDSVNVPLNAAYYMIEDSCAEITRYGHFDFTQKRFKGQFKDLSTGDSIVVAEGFYSDGGIKNGLFTTHYLNGNLQAKGNFKDNKYDGHWEIFYENGQPELTFDVVNGISQITDAWDEKRAKTVDKGAGSYIYRIGKVYWTGKLLNGTPDGTWRLFNGDDIAGTVLATEHFKKGKFHDGSTKFGDYSDASHMDLNAPLLLPLVNAESLTISPERCDGSGGRHKIINAQYPQGREEFRRYIHRAVSPYFKRMDLSGLDLTFEITGEISAKGDLTNLKQGDSGGIGALRRIMVDLYAMPALQPATVDGLPVSQQFVITFKIHNGYYTFSYKFLRIRVSK